MKVLFITTFLLTFCLALQAQTDQVKRKQFAEEIEKIQKNLVFGIQEPAQFVGGTDSMFNYFNKNLRYPEQALRKGKTGRVDVYFVIDMTDGHVRDVKILKSSSVMFEEEALRVVAAMPNWIPGRQQGRNVNVFKTLPILFNLKN